MNSLNDKYLASCQYKSLITYIKHKKLNSMPQALPQQPLQWMKDTDNSNGAMHHIHMQVSSAKNLGPDL